MRTVNKKFRRGTFSGGSALILAVVLTSLLAIIGVLFVMTTRIDKIGTSAISENKELGFAIETVIAKISQQLVLDVPGLDVPGAGAEYQDYPGPEDKWLASLEPHKSGSNYYWRQISDVTGYLAGYNSNIEVKVVGEYGAITDFKNLVANADADGDGVGDSKWIKLVDITSGKGRPIYAAIRIIDNGAMLNVNTAYTFDLSDPNTTILDIDGSSQMQINLMVLAGRGGTQAGSTEETDLLWLRANNGVGVDPLDLRKYEQNVIWSYGEPIGAYTPFDISDELELRYRFLLNHTGIDTRLENWGDEFRNNTLSTPVTSGGEPLDIWFKRAYDDGGVDPNYYAYRHIATTYNMDRIINPTGSELNNGKMIDVNMPDVSLLYEAINAGLLDADPNFMVVDTAGLAAQLAVNIADHRDYDTEVTYLPVGQTMYYGFEAQPFISEIAFSISQTDANNSTNNEFAIELYNPFDVDILLGNFRLELHRQDGSVVSAINLAGYGIAKGSRFVVTNSSTASIGFGVTSLMRTGEGKEDSNLVLATYLSLGTDPPTYALSERYDIYLLRTTSAEDIYLDKQQTEDGWFNWDTIKGTRQSYCRSDNNWNVVYQDLQSSVETLGGMNGLSAGRRNYNLENSVGPFVTIGDIARVLKVGPSTDPCDMIGMRLATEPDEEVIRLDLRNPAFANIFQYLTVIDPASHGRRKYETRIKGRINVNTAPWFVIAQLPWMKPIIAQEIVAYRDTVAGGFESIGELMQVPRMGYYAYDPLYSSVDLDRFPDLTPSDGAVSDFEERDVIFSRISNLVTVRSDVFTAYILVRIGVDGPQKRVIAILDRSQVSSPSDRVKIVALHPVPDPR
ncbi:MAG: helix-hairpin-helix domain-containing protein [Planctomycetes bacterium]|nr:helix-hairpin-helix domain-containing protein [Planctomycetota bacterium]MCH8118687.1 helix-hairpin-helix domain-containing protein [Planctomycetota bacterium]